MRDAAWLALILGVFLAASIVIGALLDRLGWLSWLDDVTDEGDEGARGLAEHVADGLGAVDADLHQHGARPDVGIANLRAVNAQNQYVKMGILRTCKPGGGTDREFGIARICQNRKDGFVGHDAGSIS